MSTDGASTELRLAPDSLEALAVRLAELLKDRGLLDEDEIIPASEVSRRWGVQRRWVYEHREELGAIPLGDGPDLVSGSTRRCSCAGSARPIARGGRGPISRVRAGSTPRGYPTRFRRGPELTSTRQEKVCRGRRGEGAPPTGARRGARDRGYS
jgi:hypothetical protein